MNTRMLPEPKKKSPLAFLGALSVLLFHSGTTVSAESNRKRSGTVKPALANRNPGFADKPNRSVRTEIHRIESTCKKCGLCKAECGFLQKYGQPGEIVRKFDFSKPEHRKIAFECNLCGLCKAVCPLDLNMADLLLEIRRHAVSDGNIDLSNYAAILNYEKLGSSALFSYYGLPEGCDAVYFPGCAFSGTRPETAWRTFEYLRKRDSRIGIVLDCCGKPSHDIGMQNRFESIFGKIARRLEIAGVKRIIVNCPSCHQTFKHCATSFSVETVYELVEEDAIAGTRDNSGIVTIHDPCPMRTEPMVRKSVRGIVNKMGFSVREMRHAGGRALCCGEGASVGFVQPELAEKWKSARKKECDGDKMITYCAACAETLNRNTPTAHILDLLFAPEKFRDRAGKTFEPPFTYIERLKLKHRFMMEFKPTAKSPP